MRLFRDETKPPKRHFKLSEQIRPTSCKQFVCKFTCQTLQFFFELLTSARLNECRHVTTWAFYFVSLARGMSDLLRRAGTVFRRGVFIPKLPLNQFLRYKDLVLFLRQFARKAVDDVVESSEYTLLSRGLYLLSVF